MSVIVIAATDIATDAPIPTAARMRSLERRPGRLGTRMLPAIGMGPVAASSTPPGRTCVTVIPPA